MESKAAKAASDKCFECGFAMTFGMHDDYVEYKGHKREFQSEHWRCSNPDCDEGILEGESLKMSFRMHAELKAEVDGTLTPYQVKKVRQKLDLTQIAASELLGGGRWAFNRYESGKVGVSAAMSNLLKLLDNDQRRHNEIKAR